MPAPATIEEFLELVRKSNLVDSQRLETYLQEHPISALPAETTLCAARFVRDGLLTNFQAKQLLLGKWRGFTVGKYRLLERLGSGGSSTVYLCEHAVMRRLVAIKVLPEIKAENPASLARFHREARAAAALDHPNIVHAYDVDQEGNVHFLVMEHVDGYSLQEIVENHGPMDIPRAAHYIRQAALGLQHLHAAGLVHRDIKPGNLLLDRTGTIKILDMGLARFFQDDQDTLTKEHSQASILGTADYLSPEQAMNSHDVDIRTDIYSLGATMYFLLTARRPYEGKELPQKLLLRHVADPPGVREFRPEVPEALEAMLLKMMAREREQRYQTTADVIEALAPWTQTPIPPPAEEEMPRFCRAVLNAGSLIAEREPSPHQRTQNSSDLAEAIQPAGQLGVQAWRQRKPGSSGDSDWPTPPMSSDHADMETPPSERHRDGDTGKGISANDTDDGRGGQSAKPGLAAWTLWVTALKPLRVRLAVVAAAVLLAALGGGTLLRWLFPPQKQLPDGSSEPSAALQSPISDPAKTPRDVQPPITKTPDRKEGPPAPPVTPGAPSSLIVTQAKKAGAFATIREALAQAKPGDRIIVQNAIHREQVTVKGPAVKNITIEGNPRTGLPVEWHPPPGSTGDQPILELSDCAGLILKGFVLDGQLERQRRVQDLVALTGRCPGLTLEDVQLQGFRRSAIKVSNCTGEDGQPVSLVRVRAVAGKNSDAVLHFAPGAAPSAQHWHVRDCRFEGPAKEVIRLAGPVADVRFERNRFFQAQTGVLYPKASPPHPIRMSFVSNTFCALRRGFHFEAVPPAAESDLVVNNNLFSRTQRLCVLDDFKPQPDGVPAQWIWFDEGDPTTVATVENGFFRRTFEAPDAPITRAVLDITCDRQCTVWLNNQRLGQVGLQLFAKRVAAFDAKKSMRRGKNVLAVQGNSRKNMGKPGPAGLLVRLTYQAEGAEPVTVVSDSLWKVSRERLNGWIAPRFDDSSWPSVKVLAGYGEGLPLWKNLAWDSVVQERFQGNPRPIVAAPKNIFRDGGSQEGFPLLEARMRPVNLPTDPTDDAQFLRYPKDHPLATLGIDGSPVGVPPASN
jgi:serine/threonine protein kinase